jgi:hypothetical protein
VKRKRPRSLKRARRRAVSSPAACVLSMLGEAKSIVYRHADGRLMHHKFGKAVRLGYTADGNALVISPVQVKPFIEG